MACWETAPTTGNVHTHLQVCFKTTVTTGTIKKQFDSWGQPNIKIPRKDVGWKGAWDYCLKSGDFLVLKSPSPGERHDLLDAKSAIEGGMGYSALARNHFPVWVKYRAALAEYSVLCGAPQHGSFAAATFSRPLVDTSQKCWVFWGPTSVGKTQFALAHFANPHFVTHIDGAAGYDPQRHDGIVWDEANFDSWPRESILHLTDQEFKRDLHKRYICWSKPAHTRIIFTTNAESGHIFGEHNFDPALLRRVSFLHCPAPLFAPPS